MFLLVSVSFERRPPWPAANPTIACGARLTVSKPSPDAGVQDRPSSNDQSTPVGPMAITDCAPAAGTNATTDRNPESARPLTGVQVAPPSDVTATLSTAADSCR